MKDDGKKIRIDGEVLKELKILKERRGFRSVSDLLDFIMTRAGLYEENFEDPESKWDCYGIFKRNPSDWRN